MAGSNQVLDKHQAFDYLLAHLNRSKHDQYEIAYDESTGFSVSVRLGQVESLSHAQEQGLTLTVYHKHRKAAVSTSNLSSLGLDRLYQQATQMVQHTEQDLHQGLPDRDCLAKEVRCLDLHHPWELSIHQAMDMAKDAEQVAMDYDAQINNSEGFAIDTYQTHRTLINSYDFHHHYNVTRHSLSGGVLAEREGQKERDFSYSTARDSKDLKSFTQVAAQAAQRAVNRLGARKIKSQKCAVVFDPLVSKGVIGHMLNAISGSMLYQKSSFLQDSMGSQIFPSWLSIHEDPFMLKGLASAPYDHEGVGLKPRTLVSQGYLQGYLLSSYSARRLGLETTGNSGGAHNIVVDASVSSQQDILQHMGTGLLVTELMGQGINYTNGDYSRGASGYWVENGVIQYPVHEITIASNLKQMFMGILATAADYNLNSGIHCGSLWIDHMAVGGY